MPVKRVKTTKPPTTGHEWDGITELDNPIPRVSILALVVAVAFAAVYQVYYPSWPGLTGFYPGLLNHSTRVEVTNAVNAARADRLVQDARVLYGDVSLMAKDTSLRRRIEPQAAVLARENCSACHGRGLVGQPGFPNLTDDAWLWSPEVEVIADILRNGINADRDEGRIAEMPAFGGADGVLEEMDIQAVTDHVLALSGRANDATPQVRERGATVYAEHCASCHGDDGTGGYANGLDTGAPDLTSDTWIYGDSREALLLSIRRGRRGVMPAWSDRLTEADIKKLALYVHWNTRDAR